MIFNQHFPKKGLALVCLILISCSAYSITDSLDFERITEELKFGTNSLLNKYQSEIMAFGEDLTLLNRKLYALDENDFSKKESFQILLSKMKIQEELALKKRTLQFKLNKARYRKGLDLIKIMYEKILGLDHHFHTLQTYQNILELSNPNSYPDFQQKNEAIHQRLKKKNIFQLPTLLQNNPYLSATFSIVGSMLSGGEIEEKEKDLNDIACILDFTVQMHSDFNLIYYETSFLKESNTNLKEECIRLFKDYCKIIDYNMTLDNCREEDDWETVFERLDLYIETLETAALESMEDPNAQKSLTKGIANLEFSIHRLLDFLDQYCLFITQGERYYQKFEVIVANYQNEEHCATQLPHQFDILKRDISLSIEKFDEAYNLSELKGSKLKDLLFGQVE
ncbi:MAG: hypothetical protein NXI23_04590 [Bacteroidetes bacterium]|jgi:hypothetical protein|nr:hypothetical protein [Bacteroidota bacterium]MDF1863793.1 hypothetical protein [Saprospiraceae bacterium]